MSVAQSQFLSNGNYQNLVGFLRQHYASRMGSNSIPERMDSRIQRTVQHYMMEVSKLQGTNRPMQGLNSEVVREASVSIDQWLHKQDSVAAPPSMRAPPPVAALVPPVKPKISTVSAAAYSRPMVNTTPPVPPAGPQARVGAAMMGMANVDEVSSIFERAVGMSATSSTGSSPWPPTVDDDEEEDPIMLMKRAQKERERDLLGGSGTAPVATDAATSGVDPTPQALPPPVRTVPLPQDYIIPQESVVKYRETEHNIFLTSSDRDWFRNRTENRYNFSVSFNPGNRTGYGFSPAVQERFRNIERIEFVKALLPTESLTTLVRNGGTKASPVYNGDRVVNVFGLPFVGVRIAELNNNGFSTNPREDNTFAIVQYDATWNSAASATTANPAKYATGYTTFIPKFLKCQRVYEPTPLAGLQKMTFRMERHDGALLSADSDVQAVARICLSGTTGGIATTNNSIYSQSGDPYIFIQTATYFPFSAFAEGDLINVQGYTASGTDAGAVVDFENFINDPGSLSIVAVAYVDPVSSTIIDGTNTVGYGNVIIVRSRFNDPATGSTARTSAYFGGSVGSEAALASGINSQASTAATAALINLNRQTHLVLRVITRDMDSASNIRPDNV